MHQQTRIITKYRLVSGESPEKLGDVVSRFLFGGWELYEAPFSAISLGTTIYLQALTRQVNVLTTRPDFEEVAQVITRK